MKVQVISFHCVLRDPLGKVLSTTFNHDILTGGDGSDSLKALSEGMKNLKKGERRRIPLTASEAYGFYEPDFVLQLPRHALPEGKLLELGSEIVRHDPNGNPRTFRVTEASPKRVTLDGNHPLAGMDLVFEIETTAARDATPEDFAAEGAPMDARVLH